MFDNEVAPVDLKKYLSPEIYGRTCAGCGSDLDWIHYRKDSSQRDGHAALCYACENAPRLSVNEHTANQREKNFRAAAAQRVRHQEDYKNDEARIGRQMASSTFLDVVTKLVPDIYIMDGRLTGDLAVFRTYPCPQPELDGRDFKYLFYVPTGVLPEFSLWEFNTIRDIRVKEKKRGWRTVLLRLIKSELLREDICNKVFGRPSGPAAVVWNRELWEWNNNKLDD